MTGPVASQVACEGVEEFHTLPTRSLALFALGLFFLRAPCFWLALGPGVHAPVNGSFCKNFSFIYVVIAPEPFAHGNLDTTSAFPRWLDSFCAMLGSTVDTCTSTVLGGNLTNFQLFLCARLGSDLVIDSRSVLRGDFHVFCSMEKCARSMLRLLGWSEFSALAIWILFHEPLASDRRLVAVSGLYEKSWGWVSAQALARVN